jgi:hypothetical protein
VAFLFLACCWKAVYFHSSDLGMRNRQDSLARAGFGNRGERSLKRRSSFLGFAVPDSIDTMLLWQADSPLAAGPSHISNARCGALVVFGIQRRLHTRFAAHWARRSDSESRARYFAFPNWPMAGYLWAAVVLSCGITT